MLTHLLGNAFQVEDTMFWGSDNSVENYRPDYVTKWVEKDCEIYHRLGLSEAAVNIVYSCHYLQFLKG